MHLVAKESERHFRTRPFPHGETRIFCQYICGTVVHISDFYDSLTSELMRFWNHLGRSWKPGLSFYHLMEGINVWMLIHLISYVICPEYWSCLKFDRWRNKQWTMPVRSWVSCVVFLGFGTSCTGYVLSIFLSFPNAFRRLLPSMSSSFVSCRCMATYLACPPSCSTDIT